MVTRIYDTFIFGGGYDFEMLRCRLMELEDSPVYRHVLVEARYDHQGRPKPLHFAERKEEFSAWSDRITHVIADIPGPNKRMNPWAREHSQRSAVYKGLLDARPEDIVWLCDVDEIPSRKMWDHEPDAMEAWNMWLAMFAVDWVYPEPTRISVAGRFANLTTLGQQRDNAHRARYPLVQDAGWHFTWLGGNAGIAQKADSFCHLELRNMILAGIKYGWWYEQGKTWHGIPTYPPIPSQLRQQEGWEVDERWPVYIQKRLCPPEWFRPF